MFKDTYLTHNSVSKYKATVIPGNQRNSKDFNPRKKKKIGLHGFIGRVYLSFFHFKQEVYLNSKMPDLKGKLSRIYLF